MQRAETEYRGTTKEDIAIRTGAWGVSAEAQAILAEYKQAHFACLIGQKTYDDYSEAQRALYDFIRELESRALGGPPR